MRVLWISAITILVDQIVKTIVVRVMDPRDSHSIIGEWFKFTYVENPGMAFGIEFGPPALISIFSIVATVLIMVYLYKVQTGYYPYRASLGLVLGGALGNIIDRVFYGAIYYNAPLFQGRVVDFIHIDVGRATLPAWIPGMGDKIIAFFPIWNVADMAIVLGVVGILIFQKAFHHGLIEEHKLNAEADGEVDPEFNRDDATVGFQGGTEEQAIDQIGIGSTSAHTRPAPNEPDASTTEQDPQQSDTPKDGTA
jgi:signal peptidase II